MQFSLVTAG